MAAFSTFLRFLKWKMDGKWSYRQARYALVRHPFLRRGVFGSLKCRLGRWHGHTHRAVYICLLTNLTGLRDLSEIQKEALDRNQFYVLQRVVIFGGCNIV